MSLRIQDLPPILINFMDILTGITIDDKPWDCLNLQNKPNGKFQHVNILFWGWMILSRNHMGLNIQICWGFLKMFFSTSFKEFWDINKRMFHQEVMENLPLTSWLSHIPMLVISSSFVQDCNDLQLTLPHLHPVEKGQRRPHPLEAWHTAAESHARAFGL